MPSPLRFLKRVCPRDQRVILSALLFYPRQIEDDGRIVRDLIEINGESFDRAFQLEGSGFEPRHIRPFRRIYKRPIVRRLC